MKNKYQSKKNNALGLDDAKELVRNYIQEHADATDALMLEDDDIYVVWFCYILGGWKTLISTTIVDGMYYEVTYNHCKNELYLDAYKKWENVEYVVEKEN